MSNNDIPDWERKYWEQKLQQKQQSSYTQMPPKNPADLPHYEPAHTCIDRQRLSRQQDGWRDVDPMAMMRARAIQGQGPQPTNSTFVRIKEGAVVFRKVDTQGFGSTVPLVRNCGQANGLSDKDFELRGTVSCYQIDNMDVVDLNEINPQKMIRLLEVRAPFVGTLLVPENAVIQTSGQTQGKQLLKG